MNRLACLLSIAVLLVLARPNAQAQSRPRTAAPGPSANTASAKVPLMARVNPALLNGLTFRLVGPSRGGRVTTVTGVPSEPRTFYMGVASGGLFRTTDGGATWTPLTDGKMPLGSTGSIAVADSNPRIVYLGHRLRRCA